MKNYKRLKESKIKKKLFLMSVWPLALCDTNINIILKI